MDRGHRPAHPGIRAPVGRPGLRPGSPCSAHRDHRTCICGSVCSGTASSDRWVARMGWDRRRPRRSVCVSHCRVTPERRTGYKRHFLADRPAPSGDCYRSSRQVRCPKHRASASDVSCRSSGARLWGPGRADEVHHVRRASRCGSGAYELAALCRRCVRDRSIGVVTERVPSWPLGVLHACRGHRGHRVRQPVPDSGPRDADLTVGMHHPGVPSGP